MLQGKRALITAGASGIGKVIAETFEKAGARIAVADVDEAGLTSCPDHWLKARLDVSDEASVTAFFKRVEDAFGGLDILCANAGIAGPTATVENVALEDWRRCVSVNLEGAFLFSKHATPMMKRQKAGVILLTSSTAGLYGFPNRAPYASAKWAINGLMKTLAMELGPFGIRANSICPGSVYGDRMERVMEKEAQLKGTTRDAIHDGYALGTSMRSFVWPEDVANMALFLASDQARLVSGQIIAVDGHTENPDPKV